MIKDKPGIIALTAVLIIGAIVLVVAVGIATRAVIDANIGIDEELSHNALVSATSCMENALAKLSDNSAYAGNETITVGNYTCTIAAVTGSGNTRTIKTSATVNGHTRRIQVTVSNINPPLQVGTWQEVDN